MNTTILQKNFKSFQDNNEIDWNIKNKEGDTAIMTALKKDFLEMFIILSQIPKIDWNIKGKDGRTVKKVARQVHILHVDCTVSLHFDADHQKMSSFWTIFLEPQNLEQDKLKQKTRSV